MIGPLLADTTPGQHPTVSICTASGGLFNYCQFNLDTLISSGIAIVVTLALGIAVARTLRSGKPTRLQMVFELFLGYVRSMVRDVVGSDAPAGVVPLAATLGFFILVANWIDFFPLREPVESANADLNLPLAMALVVFILSQAYSIRVRGLGGYLRHFLRPPFPPLTIVEEIVKPITLSLRLFGNIFAGAVMVYLLGLLFSATGSSFAGDVLSPVSLVFMTAWKLFDVLFIGAIQAYIFMLLTIVYFGQAREGVPEGAAAAPSHT